MWIVEINNEWGLWEYIVYQKEDKERQTTIVGIDYSSKGQALRRWKCMAKKLGIKKWEVK